jgi:excisionase family DNA binding protein
MLAHEKKAAVAAGAVVPVLWPGWMRISTAAKYADVSESFLKPILSSGAIRSFKADRLRLIHRDSLDAYFMERSEKGEQP